MLDSLTRSFKKLVSKKHSVVLPQPQGITTNEKLREITIGGTYEQYCAMMINSGLPMHETVCRYEFGYTYNLLDLGK